MFRINGVKEVLFSGGMAFGDRYEHKYVTDGLTTGQRTHEWGHCFTIYGSSKITIRDTMMANFTGDGCSMASSNQTADPGEEQVVDVLLENVISINNRRQGLSIGKASDVVVQYCTFGKTNGTSPECGIDVEPENGGTTRNIHVYRCSLIGNSKNGIEILRRAGVTTPVEEVYVVECDLSDNVIGGQASGAEGVAFFRNHVRRNSATGIRVNETAKDVNIDGNVFGFNYERRLVREFFAYCGTGSV